MTATLAPETTRRLATFATVDALDPIPGADFIEVAVIRGWEVVVRKGEFTVGQDVIFFEIDSALPVTDPRFAFLADRSVRRLVQPDGTLKEVHVLKTIRLRKVYSQGLALAASEFPELAGFAEGDLDAVLGITKYEPPAKGRQGAGRVRFHGLPFPSFVSKTDAERVQNIGPRTWAAIRNDPGGWEAIEKIDGSSVTVWKDTDSKVHVASRNWELPEPVAPAFPVRRRGLRGLWQKITGSYSRALAAYPDLLAAYDAGNYHWEAVKASGFADLLLTGEWLQGEVAGPGIQGNPLDLPEVRIFVFGFGGITTGPDPVREWPRFALDARPPHHPYDLPATVKETITQVEKLKSLVTPGKAAEGVVWTRFDAVPPAGLSRPVFKSISAAYLAKQS